MAYQKRAPRPRLTGDEINALYNEWTDRVNKKSLEKMVEIFEKVTDRKVDASGKCKCPFHEEKTASMSVTDGSGFYCFKTGCAGSEGSGGAIQLVMLHEGLDFREARDKVAKMVGEPKPSLNGSVPVVSKPVEPYQRRAPSAPALPDLVLPAEDLEKSSLVVVPKSFPVPEPDAWFAMANRKKGEDLRVTRFLPQMVHKYRNVDGQLLTLVVRTFNSIKQKKFFFQMHIGQADKDCPPEFQVHGTSWKMGLPSKKERKPIYGADSIREWLAIPEERRGGILVVEGEKCADYAKKILADKRVLVLSPMGGTQGVPYADWTPLLEAIVESGTKSVKIITWPDNDPLFTRETGEIIDNQEIFIQRVSNGIKRDLETIRDLRGVEVPDMMFFGVRAPSDKEGGWDIADAVDEGWSREKVIGHIRSDSYRVEPVPVYVPEMASKKEPEDGLEEGEIHVEEGPQ